MRRARLRFHRPSDMLARVSGLPRTTKPGTKTEPIGINLAFITVCAGPCGKTFVSVIREFPIDYVCVDCLKLAGKGSRKKVDRDAFYALQKQCEAGHLLTPTTTYFVPATGQATCRVCRRERGQKRSRQ